jgi:hypothetical protein
MVMVEDCLGVILRHLPESEDVRSGLRVSYPKDSRFRSLARAAGGHHLLHAPSGVHWKHVQQKLAYVMEQPENVGIRRVHCVRIRRNALGHVSDFQRMVPERLVSGDR